MRLLDAAPREACPLCALLCGVPVSSALMGSAVLFGHTPELGPCSGAQGAALQSAAARNAC